MHFPLREFYLRGNLRFYIVFFTLLLRVMQPCDYPDMISQDKINVNTEPYSQT